MSSSNYLKPDLLDTSKVATSGLVTDLTALATAVVSARTKFNGADIEHALVNLQVVADALARLHL